LCSKLYSLAPELSILARFSIFYMKFKQLQVDASPACYYEQAYD
jgi:hypothetical protein